MGAGRLVAVGELDAGCISHVHQLAAGVELVADAIGPLRPVAKDGASAHRAGARGLCVPPHAHVDSWWWREKGVDADVVEPTVQDEALRRQGSTNVRQGRGHVQGCGELLLEAEEMASAIA